MLDRSICIYFSSRHVIKNFTRFLIVSCSVSLICAPESFGFFVSIIFILFMARGN